jgi:cell division protein FtsW
MGEKLINQKNNKNKKNLDLGMLVTIIVLLCLGIIMVSSASSYYSLSIYGDSNYLLTRQLGLAIAGLVAMFIISNINYKNYKKISYIGYVVSLVLLILVLVPGVGQTRNGATRWLGFGALTFQPSEIMKIMLVMATATYLAINHKKIIKIKTFFIPIMMLVLVISIMFLQNHMSGTIVMMVASTSVILASGVKIKIKYIAVIGIILALAITSFIIAEPFRVKRLLAFTNPESDIKGDNWQAAQSLYAIGSGGIFGRGLRTK